VAMKKTKQVNRCWCFLVKKNSWNEMKHGSLSFAKICRYFREKSRAWDQELHRNWISIRDV
jgi:hypothetical protein